eukprot:gene19045-biopygen5470
MWCGTLALKREFLHTAHRLKRNVGERRARFADEGAPQVPAHGHGHRRRWDWKERPRPRAVRVRFFKFYRAPRVRSASAAVPPVGAAMGFADGGPDPARAETVLVVVALRGARALHARAVQGVWGKSSA